MNSGMLESDGVGRYHDKTALVRGVTFLTSGGGVSKRDQVARLAFRAFTLRVSCTDGVPDEHLPGCGKTVVR